MSLATKPPLHARAGSSVPFLHANLNVAHPRVARKRCAFEAWGCHLCDQRIRRSRRETGSPRSGDPVMSELGADRTDSASPVVQFAPPDITRRRFATWNGIQTDAVELLRREPFQAGFQAPYHLLIMCERAERDEGETLVEGLPRSTLHEFSRTLSFVPAGHRFCSWHKPRILTRATYFY